MPNRLHRDYGAGHLHFLTTSCYRRRPLLGTHHGRDLFLHVLEQVRRRYHFVVAGCVVMPEHVHLLLGEPERGNPSGVILGMEQLSPLRRRRAGAVLVNEPQVAKLRVRKVA